LLTGKLLINGRWVQSRNSFDVTNPATEKVIGRASQASLDDVQKAVRAARGAFNDWKHRDISERAKLLVNIADCIQRDVSHLSQLITQEMGRPVFESAIEVNETCDMIRYFANEGKAYLEGEAIPINHVLFPNKFSFTKFEPIGVVGIIKPWNYPLELPFWAVAPALLAGNTVVLKPSELTPFVGVEIGRICQASGVPDGVVNVVTGDGSTGVHLVDADVDMVAFTGSAETGKKIMERSGKGLHRLSLELGGSDPALVFDDADLEEAIDGTVWGRFANCGQVCTASKRIFVQNGIADQFIGEFTKKVKSLELGDGLKPQTDMGPLVSSIQRDKIEEQVKDAVEKGARVEYGGKRPSKHPTGYFYEPTVLTGVNQKMRVMKEEVFGPVAPISLFRDAEDAIAVANSTRFGLGASVWTKNLDKALEVTASIDAGMVWVNDVNVAYAQCPWGGVKDSGMGRELSKYGIHEFANIKHVNLDYGRDKTRPWWFPYHK
jgi:acyl-CoA reductase-like NAD-dependent aldehyde dehydrogenase